MVKPTFTNYVNLLFTLFEHFWQHHAARPHSGHPLVYEHKALIVFFSVMQQRRIFRFNAQRRWLKRHPEMRQVLGLDEVRDVIAFVGPYGEALAPRFASEDLYTDKSLFKAQGPVWHQGDRKAGRIPEKLRHLDSDASWSKSGYHGWVYGYALDVVGNRAGFVKLIQVETAAVSEKTVIDQQSDQLIGGKSFGNLGLPEALAGSTAR